MRRDISATDLWYAMRKVLKMTYSKMYMTWPQQKALREAAQLMVEYADQAGINLDDDGLSPPEARTYREGLLEWERAQEVTDVDSASWQETILGDEYFEELHGSFSPVSPPAEEVPLEVYRAESPDDDVPF